MERRRGSIVVGLAALALCAALGCSATIIREDEDGGEGATAEEIQACVDELGEHEATPSGDCQRYCAAYSCADCESTVAECETRCADHIERKADDAAALACFACAAADVAGVVELLQCDDFATLEGGAMLIRWRISSCPECEI
jgi:hypothetical protein